ncbi:unnamed protein product, partial [marine sediment metagenome]
DTARNILAMKVDCLVVRHPTPGTPHLLAKELPVSVINAGDGAHEHPTQALLDLYTIREQKGEVEGLKIVNGSSGLNVLEPVFCHEPANFLGSSSWFSRSIRSNYTSGVTARK